MKRPARSKRLLLAAAALAAALVAGEAVRRIASRKTEVDLLMEVLVQGDEAEAVWAFERLKKVPEEDLADFLPFVGKQQSTRLHAALAGGAASSRDEAGFRVGEITELLLSARLGLTPSVQPQNREGREWSKGLLFVDAAPSRVVRRFLSGQAKLRGLPPKG